MHERGHQQHLPHALAEQHVHVFGIDERQRDAEHGRQREQHVAGQPAVRRVDAHLAQDLEPLAHDVREVLENFRRGCRRSRAGSAPRWRRTARRGAGCAASGCRARPSAADRSSARRTSCGTPARPAPASRRRPSSARWRTRGRPSARARSGRAPPGTVPRTCASARPRLILSTTNGSANPTTTPTGRPHGARVSTPAMKRHDNRQTPATISNTPLMLTFMPDCSIQRAKRGPARRCRPACDRAQAADPRWLTLTSALAVVLARSLTGCDTSCSRSSSFAAPSSPAARAAPR